MGVEKNKMAMKDLLQVKKKLKSPYFRRWYHGKGDDTYQQSKATKKGFTALLKAPQKIRSDYYVAYKGKEYGVNEFVKKYPKMALLKKKVKRRLKKK